MPPNTVGTYGRTRAVQTAGDKKNVIRAIQIAEGHIACFGTRPVSECPEISCIWRLDCRQIAH